MNDTCVYLHTRLDGVVFYVGIGSLERAESHKGRNAYWHKITEKHGYTVSILHTGLSWEAACALEIHLIAKYREISGVRLCNATIGGEGAKGLKHSQETKDKISVLSKAKKLSPVHKAALLTSNLGTTKSDGTKVKMSTAKLGKKRSPESVEKTRVGNSGQKRSAEFGEAVRARMLGQKQPVEILVKLTALRNTPEYKAKMKAIHDTPEFKEKCRAAALKKSASKQ